MLTQSLRNINRSTKRTEASIMTTLTFPNSNSSSTLKNLPISMSMIMTMVTGHSLSWITSATTTVAGNNNDYDEEGKGEVKTKQRSFHSRWAEGRNLDPENPDRQGSGEQTVEEALYVIGEHNLGNDTKGNVISFPGKNILGRNVTNRLLPVAAQLTRGLGLVGHVKHHHHQTHQLHGSITY